MAVDIRLDDRYSIKSDRLNWILSKKNKNNRDEHVGYYNNIGILLKHYVVERMRLSDCKTMDELSKYMEEMTNHLNRFNQVLNIKVTGGDSNEN